MKNRIFIFTENNVREFVNPTKEELEILLRCPNVIANPDLSQVRGVERHFWKLVGDKVLPMTLEERKEREYHIVKHGFINTNPFKNKPVQKVKKKTIPWGYWYLGAGVVSCLIYWVLYKYLIQ